MSHSHINSKPGERMKEILDRHAEALVRGDKHAAVALDTYGGRLPELDELVRLAQRLHQTLVPVEPSEEFVNQLQTRLARAQARRKQAVRRWNGVRKRLLGVSSHFGVILSVVAVLALVARIVGSLVMLIMILSGRRRRSTAAA